MQGTITPRVQKALDVLINAFNTDTLMSDSCTACAVGNLVADGKGATLESIFRVIFQARRNGELVDNHSWYLPVVAGWPMTSEVEEDIKSTNFNIEELRQIERAFEGAARIKHMEALHTSSEAIKKDLIKGLQAVAKCLLEMDGCTATVKEALCDRLPVQSDVETEVQV